MYCTGEPTTNTKHLDKYLIDMGHQEAEAPTTEIPAETDIDLSTPISYRICVPKFTQFLTRRHFHYFKVRLANIGIHFQVKKGWNTAYTAAQQIYSDAPTSAALRAAIYAEHTILYSGRPFRWGNEEGTLERHETAFFELLDRYQDGPLSSLQSTCARWFRKPPTLSRSDGSRRREVRIYTYTLMDDSIRFSRSGVRVDIDMASKHALHAGAAYDVFYAGEFWVEYDKGERTLFVDNNSGTFAPPKEDLPRMVSLMQDNFPGMRVVALDYQDPEWKRRRGKD